MISFNFNEQAMGEPKKWQRFKDLIKHDYIYLYATQPDAIRFIPKKDIWFFGFGLFPN